MKFLIVLCALVAAVAGDVSHLPSSKYLPPSHQHAASAPAVSYSAAPSTTSYQVEAASAPAVSYSAPAAESYHVEAASAPAESYSAPATQSFHVEAASAPAASYSAPDASSESASYEVAASEPAHTFSASEGYRYKTAKRLVIRRRRDVSHLSSEYLPPVAASAPVAQYESAPSFDVAASAPAVSYAPEASYTSYETSASEPAHSFSSGEGYRYKTAKRRVIRRHRRDVSHLSSEYLPPVAASAPVAQYESAPSFDVAASAPAVSYAPEASYTSYETSASEPAHSFSSGEGYRYKTAKRRVIRRHRRDVSHLSSEYLPPVAASAPVAQYESAPSFDIAASAPAVSYAPEASYTSYETSASEPAHSFSSGEGYRYKTAKRRVIRRHRRDVSHLSSEYLPPVAASAPVAQYESAPSYDVAASAPAVSYAPDASYSSYETAASEPAHSFSSGEGYRYKTAKRRVIRRHRRDVSHLSSEYLPPHQGAASAPLAEYLPPVAASAPVAQYQSAPSFSVAASAPAVSFSAPVESYSSPAASYSTYETAASEPAHSYSSAEGYRYKTAKRRVIRRHRF